MREFETERLRLRYVTENDIQAVFDGWANDPEVTKYMTWNAHESVKVTRNVMNVWLEDYRNENCFRYGIERKSDGVLMGMIDVVGYRDGNPVIGYCSGRKYWGKGYMTEALRGLVDILFSEGYDTVEIEAVKENIGSNRVIEKAGFEFVLSYEEPLSQLKPQIVTINTYRLSRYSAI